MRDVLRAERAGRPNAVFFFELLARELAAFLVDFFFEVDFLADFFRVTLRLASFLLADDRAALVFFLLVFFLADFFLLTFFLLTFFLLAFFLLVAFLRVAFFLLAGFLALDFFDARAVARLRDDFFADFFADFFETFFLVAAFRLGMRETPGRLQMQPAIIQIRTHLGSLKRRHRPFEFSWQHNG